jgi:very-short-patch-repair endonuclease
LILIYGDLQKPEILQTLVNLTLAALDPNVDYRLKAAAFGVSFSSGFVQSKEQRTIGQIVRAFAHFRAVQQYRVPPYALDLYFPDQRIAVECDEDGHRHNDPKAEIQRQRHIERALGCTFVRYNPDAPDFNIGDVINKIMLLIHGPMLQKEEAV